MKDNSQYGFLKQVAEVLAGAYDAGNGQLRVNDSTADGGSSEDVAVTADGAATRKPLLVDPVTGRLLVTTDGGSGGGGGGPVTIADGADAALGKTTDAAKTDTATGGTVISWLKGILATLKGVLNVQIQNASLRVAQNGAKAPALLTIDEATGRLLVDTVSTTAQGVSIGDGKSAALGATTDAAKTDVATPGSTISWLKGIIATLKGTLRVAVESGAVTVARDNSVDRLAASLTVDQTSGRLLVQVDGGSGVGGGTVDQGAAGAAPWLTKDDQLASRIGALADAESAGNGSVIAILKRIRSLLSGTLTVDTSDRAGRAVGVVTDGNRITQTLANRANLSVAGAAQLVAAGAQTKTFSVPVKEIMVNYASHACYIAKTAAGTGVQESGIAGDRIYIAAGAVGLVLPWNSDGVYFINAVASEQPEIFVTGLN